MTAASRPARAVVRSAGLQMGWTVTWTHPIEGEQFYYSRSFEEAERVANSVNTLLDQESEPTV